MCCFNCHYGGIFCPHALIMFANANTMQPAAMCGRHKPVLQLAIALLFIPGGVGWGGPHRLWSLASFVMVREGSKNSAEPKTCKLMLSRKSILLTHCMWFWAIQIRLICLDSLLSWASSRCELSGGAEQQSWWPCHSRSAWGTWWRPCSLSPPPWSTTPAVSSGREFLRHSSASVSSPPTHTHTHYKFYGALEVLVRWLKSFKSPSPPYLPNIGIWRAGCVSAITPASHSDCQGM